MVTVPETDDVATIDSTMSPARDTWVPSVKTTTSWSEAASSDRRTWQTRSGPVPQPSRVLDPSTHTSRIAV